MAGLCVGCGLGTDNTGRLIAAVAGVWGSAPLNYPAACAQTRGVPIWCDANGQLRGAPEHTAVRVAVDNPVDLNRNVGAGDEWYTATSVTYTNPSSCRSMLFIAVARGEFRATIAAGGQYRFRLGNPMANDGSGVGIAVLRDSHTGTGTKQVEVAGNTHNSLIVPPGGAASFTTGVTTQCPGGSLTVTHHRYFVTAIGVTL